MKKLESQELVPETEQSEYVQTYPLTSLEDPSFGADDPTVQARVQQLAAECA